MSEYTVSVEFSLVGKAGDVYPCSVELQVDIRPKGMTSEIIPMYDTNEHTWYRCDTFCSWDDAEVWVEETRKQILERIVHLKAQRRHSQLELDKPDNRTLVF